MEQQRQGQLKSKDPAEQLDTILHRLVAAVCTGEQEGLSELVLSLKAVETGKIKYQQIMVRPLIQKLTFLSAESSLPNLQVLAQTKRTLMRTFEAGFRDTTRVSQAYRQSDDKQ